MWLGQQPSYTQGQQELNGSELEGKSPAETSLYKCHGFLSLSLQEAKGPDTLQS